MRSSSWSVPKPKLWILKAPSSWLAFTLRAWLIFASAPLSWPSERRNTDVTVLGILRSLIVWKAKFMPLKILVPPEALRFPISWEKATIFSWETVLRGHILRPLLLKVMIESLSLGVRVSIKNFIVSLTSSIFWPYIDPLTSMTQIRSTLVLVPPLASSEHIAGITVCSPSLTCERWALSKTSIFPYLLVPLTLSTNG